MVTKPKDLRTGRSLWEQSRATSVPHNRLFRDLDADVLIIGAGITGAMIADGLRDTGLNVIVVDRRGLAKGSSTASTALVQYELDTPLTKLSRKIGQRNAERAWRRSRLAVDSIAARLRELEVTDVAVRDSLYLAGDELNHHALKREHHARRAIGLPSLFVDRTELRERFGVSRAAALLGYGNLAIDPRNTTLALLKAAASANTRIFCPADIVDIDARRNGVIATAASGQRIRCRHLVLATGYEFPKRVPAKGHQIISTWAIATVPQKCKLWPEECMIWEAADPYLYLRTTSDGRIIIGGEDEDFSDEDRRDALLLRKTVTLQRKLSKLIPRANTAVEFAWTGSFGTTTTGLPTIGQIPRMQNCWVALGYGGNGTTYSRIAADIITSALSGHADTDADLYNF